MLVYLFVVAAIYTLSPITNAVSDCSLCKLNEYYNETTGYQCFRLSNGQVACTCPDYRYALDKPCRICERPNICGDDPNNLCAELSPTSFDPENDNDKNFACFCSDLSYYLGEPCPSISTTPTATTILAVNTTSTFTTEFPTFTTLDTDLTLINATTENTTI